MNAQTRRAFFRKVTGGVVGGWELTRIPPGPRARYIVGGGERVAPDEERFWEAVRGQFPLTRDRIYLNNGTVGPSPYVVIEAVRKTMTDLETAGEYAGWEEARSRLAKMVKVDETEIALTHNTTEGLNIVAWGLPLKGGDEVIMTTHEHVGNALPWLNRSRLDGIRIRAFVPAASSAENLNRIEALISPRTRVIAVPHVSCTIGQVFPVREISSLGKRRGLFVLIDGAHGPGMIDLDLRDIGCDFYAACGHKWMCGPKGTGFLYVRKELLDLCEARWVGGHSDLGWDLTVAPPAFKGLVPGAHRYDFGTQSAPLFVGLGAAVDFLCSLGIENIVARCHGLATYLQEELLRIEDKVEMLTPAEKVSRGAIVGFRPRKVTLERFQAEMDRRKIRIRRVLEAHLESVRVSTHLYNSREDVDRFVAAVKEI